MRILHFLLLLTALAPPPLSRAETAGLIEPKVLWDNLAVSVCWDDEARVGLLQLDASEKTHYQRLIEREYTAEKTGVHFIGWKNCSEETPFEKFDVMIQANSNELNYQYWGYSNLALGYEDSSIKEDGTYDQSFYTRIDSDTRASEKRTVQFALHRIKDAVTPLRDLLKNESNEKKRELLTKVLNEQEQILKDSTFIHEFGHMAGMRHEHARNDRDAKLHSAWQFRLAEDQLSSATTYNTPYDHLSIMNYNHTGVVKSLIVAKYICEAKTSKYKARFTQSECEQINRVLPQFVALTAYDQMALQKAYLGKSSVTDFNSKTRAFIDQITAKIKKSTLVPLPQ